MIRSTKTIKCPQCGFADPFYDDEGLICRLCGFVRDYTRPPLGKDSKPVKRFLEIKGYGAYFFRREGGGINGPILEKIDDADAIRRFNNTLKKHHYDWEISFLTKWDDKKKRVVYLAGCPEWEKNLHKRWQLQVKNRTKERALERKRSMRSKSPKK